VKKLVKILFIISLQWTQHRLFIVLEHKVFREFLQFKFDAE